MLFEVSNKNTVMMSVTLLWHLRPCILVVAFELNWAKLVFLTLIKSFPNNASGKILPTVLEKYKFKKRYDFNFTVYITGKVGKKYAKIKPQYFEIFFRIFMFIQRQSIKTSSVDFTSKNNKETTKQELKINKLLFL